MRVRCSIYLIALLFMLPSCVNNHEQRTLTSREIEIPNEEGLKNLFKSNRDVFEKLMEMIRKDTPSTEKCSTIGPKHIQRNDHGMGTYWSEDNGLWNTGNNYSLNVSLEEVLSKVGMRHQRYQEYLGLLKKINSEHGISYCNQIQRYDGKVVSYTALFMSASGLSISGCSTHIFHRGNEPIPEDEIEPGYFYKRVPIDSDWYIEYSCT